MQIVVADVLKLAESCIVIMMMEKEKSTEENVF